MSPNKLKIKINATCIVKVSIDFRICSCALNNMVHGNRVFSIYTYIKRKNSIFLSSCYCRRGAETQSAASYWEPFKFKVLNPMVVFSLFLQIVSQTHTQQPQNNTQWLSNWIVRFDIHFAMQTYTIHKMSLWIIWY